MNSENIKKVTNQAIEQLISGAQPGSQRNADAIPCSDWKISPLQPAKRDAHRITEANGHACSWLSRLAEAWTIREEGRERNSDPCSHRSAKR